LADNLVQEAPEVDGVDHHVEPSRLPEGAAPAVTDEVIAASGQTGGTGEDSHTGARDAAQQAPEPGLPAAEADPSVAAASSFNGGRGEAAADPDLLSYGQAGAYTYEQAPAFGYRQDASFTPVHPAGDGYNAEMSQPDAGMGQTATGDTPTPPLPAELPAQQTPPASSSGRIGVGSRGSRKARSRGEKARPRGEAGQARRANLVIARFEPWSVMKFSFLMSLVAWLVLFVAVALLYYALSGLGVFGAIQRTLQSVTSSQQSSGVNLAAWTSAPRILGYTMLLGAVNIVLITVLTTLGAMIYNLVTRLGGGVEVTLKETD
jgi:Transmembrane domain of unknown function (DUF3566)